jgi:hypothetical protein
MQSSAVIDKSPNASSTELVDAQAETPPEWTTFAAQRRRTLVFLLFAAVYIGIHLVSRWVENPLFHGDWFFFGGEDPMHTKSGDLLPPWYWPWSEPVRTKTGDLLPPWYWPWFEPEFAYRWFLTLLPLAVWVSILFFLLTRVSFLTHRRVAFTVVVLGLAFFEGNMRWFQMSNKHVSFNDIFVIFDVDASDDLGLTDTLKYEIAWQFGYHIGILALCAFLAGPEPRLCIQAIWNGPVGRSYVGAACRWTYRAVVQVPFEAAVFRVLSWLDSKAAFACIAVLMMIDPVVIWAFDTEKADNQGERSVTRQIAEANPLRFQSLDRAWDRVVFAYTPEAQELAAANKALRELDPLAIANDGPTLSVPRRKVPAQPDSVLILQAETLSMEIFNETLNDLPYLSKFSEKCLRLKRHFSVGNATHYGIMGLLHGSPVTFFTGPRGPREKHRNNPYLDHFKEQGYKTRLISRSVMSHHRLGHYLPNWTEPFSEPPGDFKVIPPIHEELAKPGPQLVYAFYHATHYPYDHDKEDRFQKYLPEVEYDFDYNRSGLFEWKDQIVNRYKNTLLNMDDWYRDILEKVDLSRTIVIITGDHGEEFFQQGRLGHCSSLNIHQTMTPCFVYIPGVEPADVTFITSHADIMPTIADALGHETKPKTLGQSLFEPVSFRYAVISHFEYTKCKLWSVATDDRMAVFERDYWDNVEITSLTDWKGRRQEYVADAEIWNDRFRIIRRVEDELRASRN